MRRGIRLGIDYGSVRIGVARSDPHGMLAVPVKTVVGGDGAIAEIRELAVEFEVLEIVVGLPLSMSGKKGKAANLAESFARRLAKGVSPIPVLLLDERLSTVESARSLSAAGRNTRKARSVIDQAAAVTILQGALDTERRTNRPAGISVGT